MTTQPPAVLSPALFVKVFDQGRRGLGFPVKKVFRFAVFSDLNHAQVIALDTAGTDEADDILAGEPAVHQHVPEPDAFADDALDHSNHQIYLAPRVFVEAILQDVAAVTLFGEPPCPFLVGHPELPLLAFLAQEDEVEEHLGGAVREGKEQGLEAEDAPVLDMGEHPADVFHAPSPLGEVRVVDYQADRAAAPWSPETRSLSHPGRLSARQRTLRKCPVPLCSEGPVSARPARSPPSLLDMYIPNSP